MGRHGSSGGGWAPPQPSGPSPEEIRRRQEEERRRQQAIREEDESYTQQMEGNRRKAEEEERQRFEEWKSEFEKDKGDVLKMLKGVRAPQADLELKDVRGGTRFFGLGGGNPDMEINDRSEPGGWRPETARRQLYCLAYLSQKATQAVNRGDFNEAGYLSDQAARIFDGGTLDVQCPSAPPLAKISAEGLGRATTKQTPQQIELDQLLQKRFEQNMKPLIQIQKRKRELAGDIEKRQRRIRDLEAGSRDAAASDAQQSKQDAVQNERALLEEAMKLLDKAGQDEQDLQKTIDKDMKILEQVAANPDLAAHHLDRMKGQNSK